VIKPRFKIEESGDATEVADVRSQHEHQRRNREWLQDHWEELVARARGRFLAVANQQAFIAETPEEAWEWVERTHPGDGGAFVQHVRATSGPRIYDCRRGLV
jgi:hypothetical protein